MSIDDYELRGELARGSMGVVYRAYDSVRDCDVALKRMRHPGSRDDFERFRNEVEAAKRICHPHVVGVHAAGQDESGVWMTMDLVEGTSLYDRFSAEGPLPVDDVVRIGLQLADALAHAHELGIIHRDLKPHNVLLDADGNARLADFGLARLVDRETRLTQEGDIMGTPVYMSPEQALGQRARVGPASDLYGLGATLYHALTGRPPFLPVSVSQLMKDVVHTKPPRPSGLREGVPPALDAVLLRCLSKAPAGRFASASELADALRQTLVEDPAAGSPRTKLLAAGAGLALVALLAVAAVAIGARGPAAPPDSPVAANSATETPTASPAPTETASAPSPTPAESPALLDLPREATQVPNLLDALRSERALAQAERVVAHWPDEALAHLALADALAEVGRWTEAERAYREAFQRDPTLPNSGSVDPRRVGLVSRYATLWGDDRVEPSPAGWEQVFGGCWALRDGRIEVSQAGLGTYELTALLREEAPATPAYRLEVEVNLNPRERADQTPYAGVILGALARDDFFTLFLVRNRAETDRTLSAVGGAAGYVAEHGVEPTLVRMTRQIGSDWRFPANQLLPPQRDAWIRLAVEVDGARLKAWVGGAPAVDVELARPLDGRVGLLKYYQHEIHYRGWRFESR
jgi:serine/threonine protein kinase